jgi:hypothetical protein
MFNISMLERKTGVVRIEDFTLPVVRAMIKYYYQAKIDFTDEVTPEISLEIAHKYEINLLKKRCEKVLIESMDSMNLTRRLKLAKKVDSKALLDGAIEYLEKNFKDAILVVMNELL